MCLHQPQTDGQFAFTTFEPMQPAIPSQPAWGYHWAVWTPRERVHPQSGARVEKVKLITQSSNTHTHTNTLFFFFFKGTVGTDWPKSKATGHKKNLFDLSLKYEISFLKDLKRRIAFGHFMFPFPSWKPTIPRFRQRSLWPKAKPLHVFPQMLHWQKGSSRPQYRARESPASLILLQLNIDQASDGDAL